jgi:hypothetical protein
MLACWVEDPNGDYFKKHIARIPDYIWVAEDGIKMQVISTYILQKQLHTLLAVVEHLNYTSY